MSQTAARLLRQGQYGEAATLFQALLKSDPRNFDCLRDLGLIRLREGRFEEATQLFGRALERNPRSAAVQSHLGAALAALGRFSAAVARQQKAVALDPANVEAQTRLGAALLAIQQSGPAVAAFEKALAADPGFLPAVHGLGDALEALGRPQEAARVFEAALERAPRNGLIHRRLAECRRHAEGDPHLQKMETLLGEAPPLPGPDQAHLHGGLAKAYADLGRHETSFHHAIEGNRVQREQFSYREAETLGLLTQIREAFPASLLTQKLGMGHPSPAPIFIIGMPRSGSTLVEEVLASHPRVFGAGEVRNFDTAVGGLGSGRLDSEGFLDRIATLDRKALHRLGAAYLASIDFAPRSAQRVTNKLLGNFLYAGLIHLALPNARLVHVTRDAVDTCVSRFTKLMIPGQPYSYDLAELGRYHRAYEALMDHWRRVLPAGVMLDVRYEDVVADLEGQARRLVEHCGLAWDPACLDFHKTERAVLTPSRSQVREPLHGRAVGRWRRHADMLRPLLVALGRDGVE